MCQWCSRSRTSLRATPHHPKEPRTPPSLLRTLPSPPHTLPSPATRPSLTHPSHTHPSRTQVCCLLVNCVTDLFCGFIYVLSPSFIYFCKCFIIIYTFICCYIVSLFSCSFVFPMFFYLIIVCSNSNNDNNGEYQTVITIQKHHSIIFYLFYSKNILLYFLFHYLYTNLFLLLLTAFFCFLSIYTTNSFIYIYLFLIISNRHLFLSSNRSAANVHRESATTLQPHILGDMSSWGGVGGMTRHASVSEYVCVCVFFHHTSRRGMWWGVPSALPKFLLWSFF